MQKIILSVCTSFAVAILISGCGVKPYVNSDTSEECATAQKKLLKVNHFTKVVNETSAFHLEESASAIVTPGITKSNNKRQMLRDAAKRKKALEKEQKELGCEIASK